MSQVGRGVTRPLTARTLRDLIADQKRLARDPGRGMLRYELNGRRGSVNLGYIVNAVARARKLREAGAVSIQIRRRADHPWIDFPKERDR